MNAQADTFTNAEKQIYQYIQEDYDHLIAGGTILDFAKANGVSKSAVLRFAQKLGFSGYPELKLVPLRLDIH